MDKDRVVLVTGATGSLGSVVAAVFARQPVRLVLTGRDQVRLDRIADTTCADSDRCFALAADVTDPDNVEWLAAKTVERFGRIDVLLNTVGGYAGGRPAWETSDETWEQLWRLNVMSCVHTNRAVLPHMLARKWGRIVNIAAKAAVEPRKNSSAYAAAKAAVLAFTLGVAIEVKGMGVTANVLLPSTIDSPANRESISGADPHRWVQPAEIAAMMLFLSGEESASINGAAIPIYGQS